MAKRGESRGVRPAKWMLLSFILAGVAAPVARAEKITLGLHLKSGQTFRLLTTTESNLVQTIMGQEMNATSTNGMGYTYEVLQVADDGTATCKVTYDTVQVKMSMGGFGTEYDSTKPPASVSPMVKPYAGLIGQSFTMRISPAGRVLDVQGVEAIYQKVLKDLELPDESMRAMIEQQVKEQLGADAIREAMEQAIGVSPPEGAVDIGDSWVKQVSMTRPYPMKLESKFTLKERRNGVAVIDVVSKVGADPTAKPMQLGPMSMTYDLTGERKGQLQIDEASGWTIGATYTQQISGTIKAEGGPQGPMSIPITGTVTIRTETRK